MSNFDVGFVVFSGITQLDFTGPFEVLSRLGTPASLTVPSEFEHARTHVIAKTMDPVVSDRGLSILPSCTFSECPKLDLICVPGGGLGVLEAIKDAETVAFLRLQGTSVRYVTSVCTGAFLIGAAGLLRGRKATTHWAFTDLLPLVGASYQSGRVVRDGNVFTGGGVSAGIDFAFSIISELAGPQVAQAIQLAIEYDPAPPFDCGHPTKASEASLPLMIRRNEQFHTALMRHFEASAEAGRGSP